MVASALRGLPSRRAISPVTSPASIRLRVTSPPIRRGVTDAYPSAEHRDHVGAFVALLENSLSAAYGFLNRQRQNVVQCLAGKRVKQRAGKQKPTS